MAPPQPAPEVTLPTHTLNAHPFAGRIGGNQRFAVTPKDPEYLAITSRSPDATNNLTWGASLSISFTTLSNLWKPALIEGVAMTLLVYISGLASAGLAPLETTVSPVLAAGLGALVNLVLLPLFIFAAAPVSGGHVNSLISVATFAARLSTLPRAVLYVLAQCAGALVGGFMVRASLGGPEAMRVMPGCYVDPDMVTPGQAYAFETMTGLALLFLAFGVGLDPHQAVVFGPALSPILVGFTLALCTFATGFVKEGYTGASLNPARCLGLMAASGNLDYHYIHWCGAITAAFGNALLYWIVPPYET